MIFRILEAWWDWVARDRWREVLAPEVVLVALFVLLAIVSVEIFTS